MESKTLTESRGTDEVESPCGGDTAEMEKHTRCSSTAASGSCEHSSNEASKKSKKDRRRAKWKERNAKRKEKEKKEKALEVAYSFWGIEEITRIVLSILAPEDSASLAATCRLFSVSCTNLSRQVCCITAGSIHTVVATKSGAVLSWGGGVALGYAVDSGGLFSQSIPRAVSGLSNTRVVLVSSADEHVAAVTSNGEVWTWGSNEYGQLGHGTKESAIKPKRVEALDRITEKADEVIAADFCTFIVTKKGDLFTCGCGKNGVLGFTNTQDKLVPERVNLSAHKVHFVTMCDSHAVAVTKTGLVFTWGQGRDGVLGHGDIEDSFLPKSVDALARKRIVKVAVGPGFTMALAESGALFSWGESCYVLGDGGPLPTRVKMLNNHPLRDIVARGNRIFATKRNGVLLGWGEGGYASGLKCSAHISNILVPRKVPIYEQRVKSVACGACHTVVLSESGRIFTCGVGSREQLGLGTRSSHYLLKPVVGYFKPWFFLK